MKPVISVRSVLLSIMAALLLCVSALQPSTETSFDSTADYFIETWEQRCGFPANDVLDITQTPDGYLWLGTELGLFRYDGVTFEAVGCENLEKRTNPSISSLTVSKSGTLWAGGTAGVMKYIKEKNTLHLLATDDGAPIRSVVCLLEDSFGVLWVGTKKDGFYRRQDGRFTAVTFEHDRRPQNAGDHDHNDDAFPRGLHPQSVFSMTEGPNGRIWVCAFNDGLFVGKNNRFEKFEIPGMETGYSVLWVLPDHNEELWVGTDRGLVLVKDGELEAMFTARNGLTFDAVENGVVKSADGAIWAGGPYGVSRITRRTDGGFEARVCYRDHNLYIMFAGTEDSLWLGSMGSGLKRLRKNVFQIYGPEALENPMFNTLHRDPAGSILAGTFSGHVQRFEAGKFTTVFKSAPNTGSAIRAMASDADGGLWLGTEGRGLVRIKDAAVTFTLTDADGLTSEHISALLLDSRNRLWAGTYDDGLNRLSLPVSPTNPVTAYTEADGLPGDSVNSIVEDSRNDIWIGTTGGLLYLPGGSWEKGAAKTFFKDMDILGILEDADPDAGRALWVCAYGDGLMRLQLPDGPITAFTPGNGLTNRFVAAVMDDRWGNLWLTAKNNILKLSKSQLNAMAQTGAGTVDCTAFDSMNGVPGIRMLKFPGGSVVNAGDDGLWFSTHRGVAVLDPQKVGLNQQPPPVVFKKITFNYENVSPDAPGRTFKGIRHLLFYYTVPTFISPRNARIKYKLEGYDADWRNQDPNKERRLHYDDVPPGDYTLRIIAANSNGVWNTTGVSYSFTLASYFHETLTYKVLMTLLILAALAGVYLGVKRYLYIRRLKLRYRNSTLDPEKAEKTLEDLRRLLARKKVFKDETITLDSLAKKLTIAPRYLSQIVNERLNQNFRDLINSYRVAEAQNMLADPGKHDYSMIDVAFESGFNSKEAFNRAFKKFTGMTPRDFRSGRRKD